MRCSTLIMPSLAVQVLGQRASTLPQLAPIADVVAAVPALSSDAPVLHGRDAGVALSESASEKEEAPVAAGPEEGVDVAPEGREDAAMASEAAGAQVGLRGAADSDRVVYIKSKLVERNFFGWPTSNFNLDVDNGQCYAGRRIQLWESMHGNRNQQWNFNGDGRIESVRCPGMYLEYDGGGRIVLGNGALNPGWTYPKELSWTSAGLFIENTHGKVLDVGGGDARNGADIWLYTKRGGDNQKWFATY